MRAFRRNNTLIQCPNDIHGNQFDAWWPLLNLTMPGPFGSWNHNHSIRFPMLSTFSWRHIGNKIFGKAYFRCEGFNVAPIAEGRYRDSHVVKRSRIVNVRMTSLWRFETVLILRYGQRRRHKYFFRSACVPGVCQLSASSTHTSTTF